MPTEYYRPCNDLLASVSILLLSSAVLTDAALPQRVPQLPAYIAASPDHRNINETFYAPAPKMISREAQLHALEVFAKKLLNDCVEVPQGAVTLLNERFWELV
jgi:hypothetical protein